MALIAVINKSTLVKDADVNTMCLAVQEQLNLHFCPAWGLKQSTIKFYSDPTKVPGYAWLFTMIDDDKSVPGALGYHTLSNAGRVEAFIMAKPTLNAGGVILFDAHNPNNYSVSGCLSHEVLEALGDRFCDLYAVNGNTMYAVEVADPVEDVNRVIVVNGQSVFVSDFIYPAWMNPFNTVGPFDNCGVLTAPFSLTKGGYYIAGTSISSLTQVFGEEVPQWKQDLKKSNPLSRGAKRIGVQKGLFARFMAWLKSEI